MRTKSLLDQKPTLKFFHDHALGQANFMSAAYPANYRIEPHIHDDVVVAITGAGAAKAEAQSLNEWVSSSTIWISGMGEFHSGTIGQECGWNYRAIYLSSSAIKSLGTNISGSSDERLLLPPGVYQDMELATLLDNLHKTIESGATLIERQALWYSTTGMLLERYGQNQPRFPTVAIESERMARVRDYMNENHDNSTSIDALASLAGLSRFHFIRSFQRTFGLPPHAYQNQIRLSAAKRLLDSGKPLADTAIEVGFYDQSHLNRLFKRKYGITPGAYSRALRTGRNVAKTSNIT